MAEEFSEFDPTVYMFSNLANAAHLNESLVQLELGEVVTKRCG